MKKSNLFSLKIFFMKVFLLSRKRELYRKTTSSAYKSIFETRAERFYKFQWFCQMKMTHFCEDGFLSENGGSKIIVSTKNHVSKWGNILCFLEKILH
jgi:hypothetical protein